MIFMRYYFLEVSEDTAVKPKPERSKIRFSKAYPCPADDCIMSFDSQEKLDTHLSSGLTVISIIVIPYNIFT